MNNLFLIFISIYIIHLCLAKDSFKEELYIKFLPHSSFVVNYRINRITRTHIYSDSLFFKYFKIFLLIFPLLAKILLTMRTVLTMLQ